MQVKTHIQAGQQVARARVQFAFEQQHGPHTNQAAVSLV